MENLLRGRDSKEQKLTRWKLGMSSSTDVMSSKFFYSYVTSKSIIQTKNWRLLKAPWKSVCQTAISSANSLDSCFLSQVVCPHFPSLLFLLFFPKFNRHISSDYSHSGVHSDSKPSFSPQSPWPFQCLGAKVELSSLAQWYRFSILLSLRSYTLGFNLGSAY